MSQEPGRIRADINYFLQWNPERKDLFSWLLSADSKGAVGTGAMVMETRTAILAGT